MSKKSLVKRAGDKTLEYAARFGSQKHLSVLRDSFALLTPLIIAGALAVLVRSFVFGGAGATQTSILGWIAKSQGAINVATNGSWSFVANTSYAQASHIGNFLFFAVSHATIDIMSIYVAFGIGYFLAGVRKGKDPVITGLLSLASFLISVLAKGGLMDAKGLLTAIIVGIISTELYLMLEKSKRMHIEMPAGVPPAVSRSFARLFPIIVTLFTVVLINLPFVLFGVLNNVVPDNNLWGDSGTFVLGDAIYHGIQSPFMSFIGDSNIGFGVAILYIFSVGLIWFFGIHGSNVLMGIFSPIYLALYAENTNGANHIFVQGTFDAFVMIGGTGATFGWIISVFLFSRNKGHRELAKLGVGPAIFQINEPVMFGLPTVLNLRYALPFIFTMPILTVTTYLGFKWFDIHKVDILIPWTAPVGVGGLLATNMDWKGFVLAIVNFLIAFIIWTPFVFLFSRNKEGVDKLQEIETRIETEKKDLKDRTAGKKVAVAKRGK